MENFNQIYERRHTNSVKWDGIAKTYGRDDLLPLWVADMDFKAPAAVQQALANYVAQGIYGYTLFPDSLYEAIIAWEKTEHGFTVTQEEILFSPGVVPSLALAIQAYTKPGEAVMIHDPVYPPFAGMIKNNQRKLVRSSLSDTTGVFTMELAAMEEQILKENVKLFLLCNPHNPGGRVWTREELQAFGDLCRKHQVIVVSDEIHQDLVFEPAIHQSFQTVDPTFVEFSLILTAATKTFNLAGIKHSMVLIKDPTLRKRFVEIQEQTEQGTINTFGLVATEAAYREGKEWLTDLLTYLQDNIDEVYTFFLTKLPKVKLMRPEATYLLWLDFSAYGLTDAQLQKKLIEEARVVLNPGTTYGQEGSQHMRLNVACPRETLMEGLERIYQAFKN